MNLKGCFLHSTVDVRTPKAILEAIEREFGAFDDPCPVGGEGGLNREWSSVTYVNPPYGRETGKWVEKAVYEAAKDKTIIMLLPARTDLAWFHDWVLRFATEVRFFRGRLKFDGYKSGAPFPSMLCVFKRNLNCSLEEPARTLCCRCPYTADCRRVSDALLLAWESETET